jgi:thiol-disulfide isomerase/thioredoxin
MIDRAVFIAATASVLVAVPIAARPDEPAPELSPSPSPTPAKRQTTPKPRPTEAPHVHGNNGITNIPDKKHVNWNMEVLDGAPFRLADQRGKVVFVNLFATWCPPCRVEQPDLVAFARAHPDDTAVIGIDLWEEDNTVREYRRKFGIGYPIAMHRAKGSLPSVFRVQQLAYPTTVVFRPDGTLSCAWDGNVNRPWFELERRYALGEETAAPRAGL